MKTTLTSTELTEIYGRSIEPVELAKFLGIDLRIIVEKVFAWDSEIVKF